MENNWTLHVRELGKIHAADITVAPMTLFVGENNSGKSYLMAVLYAILNIRFYTQHYDLCRDTPEYKTCIDWLEEQFRRCEEESHTIKFTHELREPFEALLNKVLGKNLDKIARNAFNSDIAIGSLEMTFPHVHRQTLTFLKESQDKDLQDTDRKQLYLIIPKISGKSYTRARSTSLKNKDFWVAFILELLIKSDLKSNSIQSSVFLPTSRTGFLLTYKSLVRASISDTYDAEEQHQKVSQQLTRPCSDFLKNLAELSKEEASSQYDDIIQFIEAEMVCGHIVLQDHAPQTAIYYRPDKTELDIPMHLVSGVVTELTPLLLMLKYQTNWQILFMEEPEIGLHPALQLKMARVFAKMHHSGTPLFLTTHSDIILQHFNNMIKLSLLPEEEQKEFFKRFGYDPSDVLSNTDIAMYQFDTNAKTGRSTCKKLECSDYGFLVPTFNDSLSSLLNETRELEKDSE